VVGSRLTAVFVDRDGVINRKAPEGAYITSWDAFEFLLNALAGLRLFARSGLLIVVVTNQRGIALGHMSEAVLQQIHDRMLGEVNRAGGRIDAIYHCPHGIGCRCRKPEVGMFEDAAVDFGFDLRQSAMIGDQPSDMLAAERVGALRVKVGSGSDARADHVATDLEQAAAWLLGRGLRR